MSYPPATSTDNASDPVITPAASPPTASLAPAAPAPATPPPAHPTNSNSTPIKQNSQGTERFTVKTRPDAETPKIDMAKELAGQWVGPMPVTDFIDNFLTLPEGISSESMPNFNNNFFASLVEETEQNLIYDPFMEMVTASKALPGFQLVKTAYNSDFDSITPRAMEGKPDISVYKEGLELGARLTRFEEMELLFEFKPSVVHADPFNDNARKGKGVLHPFEAKSDTNDIHGLREKCRGQIACYATAWCARQHRTHCFIIWMGDPYARIIRFDRSGAIVSAKFNYRKQGRILLEFLWRFSQVTEEVRGHDTTVSKASPEESAAAKAGLAEWTPVIDRSVLKMEIPDFDIGMRPVFVWKPMAEPYSVTGRATRGYPGWDPLGNDGKGAVVFVKDSWRSCEDGTEKESDIIKELNLQKCRNVPLLICGDDLPGQSTVTKDFVGKSWNLGGRAQHIVARGHTRFAQDFVGHHLETFKTSRQLIQAIYDALIAHKDAYEKCGILHRDISAGNVLLRKEGGGILNDWDLAKRMNKNPTARQAHRSGTWQFMSAALLLDPGKLNTVQDDMESFFWLILYHILRYMSHNKQEEVKNTMEFIFDEEHQPMPNGPVCGGIGKQAVLLDRNNIGIAFAVEGNKPLTYLARVLLAGWFAWYSSGAAHRDKIDIAMLTHDISREEAEKLYPFDPRKLAMYTYDAMIKAFDTALAMEKWPADDKAHDRLPRKKARNLEAILDDADKESTNPNNEEGQAAKTVERPTKRLKTSHKLNDEAAYRPPSHINLTPIPLSFGGRESVRETKQINYSEPGSDIEGEEQSEDEDSEKEC